MQAGDAQVDQGAPDDQEASDVSSLPTMSGSSLTCRIRTGIRQIAFGYRILTALSALLLLCDEDTPAWSAY